MELSASIGIAMHDHGAISASELINIADKAMYDSKRRGKNQFCVVRSSAFADSANDESIAHLKAGWSRHRLAQILRHIGVPLKQSMYDKYVPENVAFLYLMESHSAFQLVK